MHLAITGGSGFLGRHIAARALASGGRVTILSRDPRSAEAALAGLGSQSIAIRAAQLSEPGTLQRALQEDPPDVVVHAAALISGTPRELRQVNVEGTAAVVAACRALSRSPRLVHISTFSVQDPPPTPYSESKLAAESVVRSSGLAWVILRPTLIYGPGDAQNTGALVAALRSGTKWLPAGGRARIQPVFVEDVALACLEAATRPVAVGRTYRLGGPEPLSVRAWRTAVRDASGGRARLRSLPLPMLAAAAHAAALLGRRGALGVLAFHRADHAVDSSEARHDLGFAPRAASAGLALTFPQQT